MPSLFFKTQWDGILWVMRIPIRILFITNCGLETAAPSHLQKVEASSTSNTYLAS